MRFELHDGVFLRGVRLEDLDELYAVANANRDHLKAWMPWAVELRRSETESWLQGAVGQRDRDDGDHFFFVADGVIAGVIGFHRIDRRNDATSLGYWIAARHQGRGLVTAAVREMLGLAFGAWGLHRVEICCAPDNARSRAVPERLGFTEEGVRRDGEKLHEGFRDLVVYSLLSTD